jgi:hypothetical protein
VIGDRRLNVSTTSPYVGVSTRRTQFDAHLNSCADCQPALCSTAQAMWRGVVLASLRAHKDGA